MEMSGIFFKNLELYPPPHPTIRFGRVYNDVISFFATSECQKIWKTGKKAKIEEENLHTFWTTWWISIKFLGKIYFVIILSHKKSGLHPLSLENTISEKPQSGQIDTPVF